MSKPILKIPQATAKGYVEVGPGMVFDYSFPNSKLRRGRLQFNGQGDCICPTLTAAYGQLYLYEDYIMEKPKIKQIGSYVPNSACSGKIVEPDGVAPTVMENHGSVTAVVEPLISVHPLSHALEFKGEGSIKTISPALRATDYKCPHVVYEPSGLYDNQRGEFMRDPVPGLARTLKADHHNAVMEPSEVIGSMQANAYRGSVDGVAPCVNAAAGMGGGHVPMIVQRSHGYNDGGMFEDVSPTLTTSSFEHNNHVLEPRRYRIRKLCPTETYRLMGVGEDDIKTLLNATETITLKNGTTKVKPLISKSAHYRLAGNSIVVDVLVEIFRTAFIPNQPENQPKQNTQLSLFD